MFLTGYTVAMVTCYGTKITIIDSAMAGHLRDTNTLVSLDKQREVLICQSIAFGKVLETVASKPALISLIKI